MSEREILHLLEKKPEEAIQLMHAEYFEGLCLYAVSILKNHQVAEEIVEDLFIYLWANNRTLKIKSSIKCYFYRSIHNNCLKHLKKLKKESSPERTLHYTFTDNEILQSGSVFDSSYKLIAEELEEKADQILQTLPAECKRIYRLSRFEELSYSDIAKKLNISVGTVKTQMSRAFQKFRAGLKDYLISF